MENYYMSYHFGHSKKKLTIVFYYFRRCDYILQARLWFKDNWFSVLKHKLPKLNFPFSRMSIDLQWVRLSHTLSLPSSAYLYGLERGSPTLGPQPNAGPWPIGSQAGQVAGKCMRAKLHLCKRHVPAKPSPLPWLPLPSPLPVHRASKVGDHWVNSIYFYILKKNLLLLSSWKVHKLIA